jgi:hypothetical protein
MSYQDLTAITSTSFLPWRQFQGENFYGEASLPGPYRKNPFLYNLLITLI